MARKPKTADPTGKGKRKKLLIIAVAAFALAVAAGLNLTVFKKTGPPPAPVAGVVMVLDPVHVNLADGRYLKMTMALQMTADAAKPDGAKALDVAVTNLSLRRVSEMNTPEQRAAIKKELTGLIAKQYDKQVMNVYITEFITQ
ncbi:flagellar basal body-associated FliL family protein [Tessaracoccus sp.]